MKCMAVTVDRADVKVVKLFCLMKPRMKSVALGLGVSASSACTDITAYP